MFTIYRFTRNQSLLNELRLNTVRHSRVMLSVLASVGSKVTRLELYHVRLDEDDVTMLSRSINHYNVLKELELWNVYDNEYVHVECGNQCV